MSCMFGKPSAPKRDGGCACSGMDEEFRILAAEVVPMPGSLPLAACKCVNSKGSCYATLLLTNVLTAGVESFFGT